MVANKVGSYGRLYITKHLWLPQEPLERFNLWVSDRIQRKLPDLPAHGDRALALYPALGELQAAHDAIKGELLALLGSGMAIPTLEQVHPRDESISSPEWRNYIFSLWGNHIDANSRRCPRTVAAIAKIPGVHTALFSILDPNSKIPPHRGWAAGVVRCHYPLITPDDTENCFIRVEESRHAWREGEPFLFDDTRDHEVRNDTGQMRVVLIVDFEPPMPPVHKAYCNLRYRLVRRSREIREMIDKAAVG